jgi:dihydrofolate reductase
MSRIILDVSMSLDGFAAGPNIRADEPMGDRGELLHSWMGNTGPGSDVDARILAELHASAGATLIGRRTFDLGQKPWGGTPWPGTTGVVITHERRADQPAANGGTFTFSSNLAEAASRAKQAAGDKDVVILGPNVSQQLINSGLVDEIWLHIVPMLLGSGTPLFAGVTVDLVPLVQPAAGTITHLRLRPANAPGL